MYLTSMMSFPLGPKKKKKKKKKNGNGVPLFKLCFLPFSGGFYADNVGYVGTSCKKCPTGSFVAYDKAPGTQVQDCKTCPDGKNEHSQLI